MTLITFDVGGYWKEDVIINNLENHREIRIKIYEMCGVENDFDYNLNGNIICINFTLKDDHHPLHHAATHENLNAIKKWLASGIDVDIRNKQGETPLMYACNNINLDILIELIRCGADPNTIDN